MTSPASPSFYPDAICSGTGRLAISAESAARAYAAWKPEHGLAHLAVQIRHLDESGTDEEIFEICHDILRRALVSGHLNWAGQPGVYRPLQAA